MLRKAFLMFAAVGALTFGWPASAEVEFWFIRHGETEVNVGAANPGNPAPSYLNELTPAGRKQAEALGKLLATRSVVGLYTSDALRTIQTAYYIVAETGRPEPTIVPGIREWDPDVPASDDVEARMRVELKQVIPLWLASDETARLPSSGPQGESLASMLKRTVPAFESIIGAHKCDHDGIVAIVAHGASIGWSMPTLADNVDARMAFSSGLRNTGVVKAVLDGNRLIVTDWDGRAFDVPDERKKPRGCRRR